LVTVTIPGKRKFYQREQKISLQGVGKAARIDERSEAIGEQSL